MGTSTNKTLKFITYNVLDGFENAENRKSGVATFLKEQNPDIVFLNELNQFTNESLRDFASQYDHPYSILLSGRSSYKIAITSKTPITNAEFHYQNLLGHGFIYAKSAGIHLLCTHLNPHSISKRVHDIQIILEKLQPFIEREKVVLAGDFNAFYFGEKEYYQADRNKTLALFLNRSKDKKYAENIINNELDFSVTQKTADAGLLDLFTYTKNLFQKSCLSKLAKELEKAGIGGDVQIENIRMRIDYIWASPLLSKDCIRCGILTSDELEYFSDHYPVLAEFQA